MLRKEQLTHVEIGICLSICGIGMAFSILRADIPEKQTSTIKLERQTNVTITEQYQCPVCNWTAQYIVASDGWRMKCLNPECHTHTKGYETPQEALRALHAGEVY